MPPYIAFNDVSGVYEMYDPATKTFSPKITYGGGVDSAPTNSRRQPRDMNTMGRVSGTLLLFLLGAVVVMIVFSVIYFQKGDTAGGIGLVIGSSTIFFLLVVPAIVVFGVVVLSAYHGLN